MDVIRDSVSVLELKSDEEVLRTLPALAQLISLTGQDEVLREQLASSVESWELLEKGLGHIELATSDELRLIRGLVLLARNLVVSCSDGSMVLLYYKGILHSTPDSCNSETEKNLIVAMLQFLVNLTSSVEPVKVEDGEDVKIRNYQYNYKIIKPFIIRMTLQEDDSSADSRDILLTYLNNLFNSSEFLYNFANDPESAIVMRTLLRYAASSTTPSVQDALDPQEIIVLSLFLKIFLHESFIKFWAHLGDEQEQVEYLNKAQILLTNREKFDEFELTSVLSWVTLLFERYSAEFIESLQVTSHKESLSTLHLKLFKILDIITSLAMFNHARDFLNHYKFLPQLVSLLKVLESKFPRVVLKEVKKNNDGKLPGLKTLAIEIITFLVYQNFENQEFIRKNSALEIILNNCQLDDNEPFIKERSIVCVKYLLENNKENQEFVQHLQPEKIEINDEGKLLQMGIELNIGKDGKIQVHNKNTDKIKELK